MVKFINYITVRYANSFEFVRKNAESACLASGNFLRLYIAAPTQYYRVDFAWHDNAKTAYDIDVYFYGTRFIACHFEGKTPDEAFAKFQKMFDKPLKCFK